MIQIPNMIKKHKRKTGDDLISLIFITTSPSQIDRIKIIYTDIVHDLTGANY